MTNSTAQHSTAQHSTLQLRPATLADALILLEWRNNPITREASHNTTLINENEHIEWMKKILASENRKLYIAEIDGVSVGTVRMDSESFGYELSWTVSPAMRGLGIGKKMVSALASQITKPIRAEIKVGNFSSIRIAENAGMTFIREENGVLHYQRG